SSVCRIGVGPAGSRRGKYRRECAVSEKLAPGIRRLETHARRRSQCRLRLQRVIVAAARIRQPVRAAELRIRLDEVLRKSVEPEDGAIDARWNHGQIGINPSGLAVVQKSQ